MLKNDILLCGKILEKLLISEIFQLYNNIYVILIIIRVIYLFIYLFCFEISFFNKKNSSSSSSLSSCVSRVLYMFRLSTQNKMSYILHIESQ
jgi:uncharacterized protein YggT (Ycf19 family)